MMIAHVIITQGDIDEGYRLALPWIILGCVAWVVAAYVICRVIAMFLK